MVAASVFGVIAGVCVAIQIGLNNLLGKAVPGLWVTLVSHLGGAIFAFALLLLMGSLSPKTTHEAVAQLGSAPWYAYAGGIFGVTIVACVLVSARALPIGTTLAMVVAGQFLASVVLEHGGFFGLQHHPISAGRMVGLVMICAGSYLTRGA